MTYFNHNSHGPLLSSDQAAGYLGVSPQTLMVWRRTKRHALPAVKTCRGIKYRQSDLDALIQHVPLGTEVTQ